MKWESFQHSVDSYAQELTGQSHQTIMWLHRHDYINTEQAEELLSRMVVVPIRNSPKFGERLLARFFNKESAENSYVFPITLVDDVYYQKNNTGEDKPTLKVVK